MMGLDEIALNIRRSIFKTVCKNKAGHLASSLSSVEIMTSLYFGGVLNYKADEPDWCDRDRFVLSKGHAALCLYNILATAGYFDLSEIETFCKLGTRYGGLPMSGKVKGVEATTGSLGHGSSFAVGIAKYAKIFDKNFQVYTLLGDGELQEGEVWEAVMFAASNELDNFHMIIDQNGIQATGRTKNIIAIQSLKEKLTSFGFYVNEVDGHDVASLVSSLKIRSNKPVAIIANTIKGKGLSFVEDKEDWHYKMPTEAQINIGCRELGLNREELL